MGRQPCCDKVGGHGRRRRTRSSFLVNNGQCCWGAVPKLAGLLRCGKSCRLRWTNYLRPDLKRGLLSPEEEKTVINLHAELGNRPLPGRTDNDIKNHWNTHIKKKLRKMGIDPATHKPLQPAPPQPNEEEKAAAASAIVSGVELGNEAFSISEVPMVHLLDDVVLPYDLVAGAPPASNSGIDTAYSPEPSSSSSSCSGSATVSSCASSVVDGVPGLAGSRCCWTPWTFEDPFVTYQRIALFDHQETW
uniref:HTH myb-type domain-containing protein n=1 Tax=Setaria viridis TaxID=4556 RepID=A0A4U6VMX7_SETVI|nr:LOW QUALITY PROTEIN: hypothetical protein SEVIR_2G082000v2 [Setaria viridis]